MKKLAITAIFAVVSALAYAQAPLTIVEAAQNFKELSSFSAALKSTGLDTIIRSSGPYTIFAPSNDALAKVPAGAATAYVLKYHVIRGEFDATKLKSRIAEGDGKYIFVTLAGGKIRASLDGDRIRLTDEMGMSAWISMADIKGGNGVVHIIDTVLTPSGTTAGD